MTPAEAMFVSRRFDEATVTLTPVGHEPADITWLAKSMHHTIENAPFSPRVHTSAAAIPARTPELLTIREDREVSASYAALRGLDEQTTRDRRLEGSWSVWTARPGQPEVLSLKTSSALDPNSLLRAALQQALHDAQRSPSDRASRSDVVQRLHGIVDDWEATLKGHTTDRTMSETQIRELGRRERLGDLSEAALRGDAAARRECLSLIRFQELDRDSPAPATWSLWTSKGHPDDRRLVITNTAVDALAFHQLQADSRTRYIAFAGPPTPTRDRVLDRALGLMPPGSCVVLPLSIRSDDERGIPPDARRRSDEGRALVESLRRLEPKYPHLHVSVHAPKLATWELDALTQRRVDQSRAAAPSRLEPTTPQTRAAPTRVDVIRATRARASNDNGLER